MPSMHANEAGHTWQGSCPQLVSVTGKALFSHWSLLQKHTCARVTTCGEHCHGIHHFAAKLCTADVSRPKRVVNKAFHLVMCFSVRLCLSMDDMCRRNTAQLALRPKNIYLFICCNKCWNNHLTLFRFVFFKGPSPVQKLFMGRFLDCHTEYITWMYEMFHLACLLTCFPYLFQIFHL